jgi:hypothetical protein
MEQGDLFPPFVRGSDTSYDAAASMEEASGRYERMVLNLIKRSPKTCDECEVFLNAKHQNISARIRSLFLKGVIVDSGKRRKTRSGRNAVVWAFVEPPR